MALYSIIFKYFTERIQKYLFQNSIKPYLKKNNKHERFAGHNSDAEVEYSGWLDESDQ